MSLGGSTFQRRPVITKIELPSSVSSKTRFSLIPPHSGHNVSKRALWGDSSISDWESHPAFVDTEETTHEMEIPNN